ncbi:BTB/POZ domain-containing protein 17-like [Amphiura filiformis]|uniref:BTB/POZ domain-containing protein 17-like n=1 Tax=Amphiura filiformis TaxID=82378 RepID=UPI003B22457E
MAHNSPQALDCKDSVAEGLSRLFNDETTSDITLIVGSSRYHLHKVILTASSEYFHRMFYGGEWKESNKNEIVLHETPDCESVFDTFIRYFYSGVLNVCPESVPHLLMLADKYDAKVKRNCLQYMTDIINKGNLEEAILWIPVCDNLGATDVLERCFVIVCYNLKMASEMPHWSSLSAQHVSTILQRADIIVHSEYDVYLAVQGWILSQKECQTEIIDEILSHVQFINMSVSELVKVEESTVAKDKAPNTLRQHLYEAFKYSSLKADGRRNRTTDSLGRYTQNRNFHRINVNKKFTTITPTLRWSIAKDRYSWRLNQVQKCDALNFHITVPCVSKVENTSQCIFCKAQPQTQTRTHRLCDDLSGSVWVNVITHLQNDKGIVYQIGTKCVNTRMPTSDGGTVVQYSMVTCYKPAQCLVSFEIQN